jgi:hypothetical protein
MMRFRLRTLPRNALVRAMLGLAAFLALSLMTETAHAIPAFARKYQTSCATCHAGFPKLNGVGLAFRMNGYRFAREDEDKVKEKPIPLGNDSYKAMWPNSILPSDTPATVPFALEVQQQLTAFIRGPGSVPAPGPSPDFTFPTVANLMAAGTLGPKIGFWINGGLTPSSTAGQGFDGFIERAFISFNNLLAPDQEEDENGMHEAPKCIVLPAHMLNIRVGQFEPQVISPYTTTYRALSITGRLTSTVTVANSSFAFEPQLRGIEFYGVSRNYTTWCFGLVDGAAQAFPGDNNSNKDIYARIGHKWWGYPLDGEVVAPRRPKTKSSVEVSRAQSPDADADVAEAAAEEDEVDPTPWFDYYRQTQFETGVFGYYGVNAVSPLDNPLVFNGSSTLGLDPVKDRFYRVGVDFQWQEDDLHILGTCLYGQDSNAGTGFNLSFVSWFLEANYYFKPWAIGYARYETLQYLQQEISQFDIQRFVPGIAFYPIVNLAIRTEFVINTNGAGGSANSQFTNNAFLAMLDYAF